MAQIRNRGGGRWELIVELPRSEDGTRRRKSTIYRGKKADAERALADLINRAHAGEWSPDGITFGDLLTRFNEWAQLNCEHTSAREYERLIRKRIRPQLGSIPLHQLNAIHLDHWYAQLAEEGLAASSIRQIHAVIRSTCRQGVRWQILGTNPAASATPPKQRKRIIRPPSADEVRKLILAASEESRLWQTLVHLDAATGMRRGAVAGLQWHDLNEARQTLTIERTIINLGDGKGQGVKPYTKNGTQRVVPLDAGTLQVMTEWRADREEQYRFTHGQALPLDGHIFTFDPDLRAPMPPDTISQAWARIRKRAGLEGYRFHDLRHFVATELIAAGVSLAAVAERLGHADGTVTAAIYVHATDSESARAAGVMGDLLG